MKVYAYSHGLKALYIGPRPQSLPRDPRLEYWVHSYLSGRFYPVEYEPDFGVYPDFQARVLKYVYERVPWGRTVTYSDVARALGTHPRAVAVALKNNRHLLLIPCHRVVSKTGPGGYVLGTGVKIKLVEFEMMYTFRDYNTRS